MTGRKWDSLLVWQKLAQLTYLGICGWRFLVEKRKRPPGWKGGWMFRPLRGSSDRSSISLDLQGQHGLKWKGQFSSFNKVFLIILLSLWLKFSPLFPLLLTLSTRPTNVTKPMMSHAELLGSFSNSDLLDTCGYKIRTYEMQHCRIINASSVPCNELVGHLRQSPLRQNALWWDHSDDWSWFARIQADFWGKKTKQNKTYDDMKLQSLSKGFQTT